MMQYGSTLTMFRGQSHGRWRRTPDGFGIGSSLIFKMSNPYSDATLGISIVAGPPVSRARSEKGGY